MPKFAMGEKMPYTDTAREYKPADSMSVARRTTMMLMAHWQARPMAEPTMFHTMFCLTESVLGLFVMTCKTSLRVNCYV